MSPKQLPLVGKLQQGRQLCALMSVNRCTKARSYKPPYVSVGSAHRDEGKRTAFFGRGDGLSGPSYIRDWVTATCSNFGQLAVKYAAIGLIANQQVRYCSTAAYRKGLPSTALGAGITCLRQVSNLPGERMTYSGY